MLTIDNKYHNDFRDAFNVSVGRRQNAVYLGCAEAFIDHMLIDENFDYINTNLPAVKINFERIMDRIGEIVIIDRDLFRLCLDKVYNFKTVQYNPHVMRKRLRTIYSYNSFYEYLGIGSYYSPDDVLDINTYFDNYRAAVTATIALIASVGHEGK